MPFVDLSGDVFGRITRVFSPFLFFFLMLTFFCVPLHKASFVPTSSYTAGCGGKKKSIFLRMKKKAVRFWIACSQRQILFFQEGILLFHQPETARGANCKHPFVFLFSEGSEGAGGGE